MSMTQSGSASAGVTNTELRATPVPVQATIDTTGLATSAGQTTSNASLASIDGKLGTGLTDTQLRASAVPVSLASVPSHGVTGPLTDTQLRATAVPVSGTFWQSTQPVSVASMPSTPVTGTFWQSTQPVSIASMPSTPVTGTFWQATQPVSGPLTDAQLRASAVPVSGTFWQATQPVSGTVTTSPPANASTNVAQVGGTNVSTGIGVGGAGIPRVTVSNDSNVLVTPPTLTKGTQGATGFSVQELKDAGRVNLAWTAIIAPAATAETLATITESRDCAATATFTTKVVTTGKRLRITSVSMQVENSLGTAVQRAYLRMRVNTAGAVTTASPLQGIWVAQASGTVKTVSPPMLEEFPDGFEIAGDGTKQIGFTIQAPDWVTASATLNVYLTIFGYEY